MHNEFEVVIPGEEHAVECMPVGIAEGLREFGIETDLTAEELFELAIQSYSHSLFLAVKAGVAFMAAQEALKITESDTSDSQTFKAWIKSRSLSKQRVYEAIGLAKGFLAIPAAQRKNYLSLGKYKAIKLASIEPEALAELAEKDPDALDEMALMSREELVKKIANLKASLETEQSKHKRAVEANESRRLTDFQPRTEEIRAECMALQLEAELPINGLQMLFMEVVEEDRSQPEWKLQMEQIWVTAHVVAARAADMIHSMKSSVRAGDMPERAMGPHILTKEEAERWLMSYSTIENRYEAEKALRQTKRDEEKPRGRGRPKGSTNKTAAGE